MMDMPEVWALAISGILVIVLGGVGTLIWRHVDNAQEVADEALEKAHDVETDFLRYRVHVAENYVPRPALERMETSIYEVIARLEHKLDRVIDRVPHD